MNELEQSTTDELVCELERRFTSTLVVTVGPMKGDPDGEDFEMSYSGGLTTAVGMAARTLGRLRVMGGETSPVEDDDGEAA